ncbi:ribokinase [Kroppenstedtia sanguinis]|uniref:Ribokinase n=1 Tax=Kroppenstedtia sanguinis TaxID=1380684 RepID=A0ABW4C6T0_9BACL
MKERSARVAVIGSLNMDVVVQTRRLPQIGETVLGEEVHFIPGGKGANQAVAAARLGVRTQMIGSVGGDPFGQSLLESLQKSGVETTAVKTVSITPTGVASILLSGGDNRIIVVQGANNHCLPSDVEANRERIASVDVVLLQLEIPLETVITAARIAKELGKTVVLNPAPAQELPPELYQLTDVITPNRTELELLSAHPAGEENLEAAMQVLLEQGVGCVVTTLGEQGAALLSAEGFQQVGAHPVDVVDSTGAGDAFNAGLACALAEGEGLTEAVDFAGQVAALAVTRLGAQDGMPTRQEVEVFHGRERKVDY